MHTELPLRFNEQVLPLHISIYQQDDKEEDSKEEKQSSTKDCQIKPCWHVSLSFDLPNGEKLHCQLRLMEGKVTGDDKLAATLWAESDALCQLTRNHLDHLRKRLSDQGLTVEDLNCFRGAPPITTTRLDYQLVDITT